MCSCLDDKLREKLLRTKNLTLEKILEISQIAEQVKIQAEKIGGQTWKSNSTFRSNKRFFTDTIYIMPNDSFKNIF